jgi:ADP-dependent NAD(P)H-hydrate dehydratase / NAD(P)H-hydrate epimerase
MKALTAAEMQEVDRFTAERHGIPSLQLMENAGKSVFDYIRALHGDVAASHASVLCGKGNNGGDGFVVARLLQESGLQPFVYLFADPQTLRGDAAENFLRLNKSGADIRIIPAAAGWHAKRGELTKSRIIVDALLGTGLKGRVEGLLASVINDVDTISRDASVIRPDAVVAVDMPSGLPSDGEPAAGPVVRAHATVTFTAPKIGQLVSKHADSCGKLLVREIGSPPELIERIGKRSVRWMEPEEFRELPLIRKAASHKGNFGHVLIVAGSRGKTGAAILAGRGALRSGAGLVTIATADAVLPIVASAQPEFMTEPLLSTKLGTISAANLKVGRFSTLAKNKTLLAIGPGLGTHKETQRFVRSLFQKAEQPLLLDADGLNAFAGRAKEFARRKSLHLAVTPHPGEMARLCGLSNDKVQSDRLGLALKCAKSWNAHVILKGFHTILATPDGHAFVNTTGNPGMAKGGSGDVLTGILAGMAAQFGSANWERALALGIYLHGLAADDATSSRAEASLLSGEIADHLPETYRRFVVELQQRV